LLYEVGILFTDVRNGADLLTDTVVRWTGPLPFVLGLLGAYLALVLWLRRRGERVDFGTLLPVLLESGIYALTMGTLIVFVMLDVLHVNPRLAVPAAGPATRLLMSVGAGVHEELVFRLLLVGGGAALLEKAGGMRRWKAVVLAVVASSLLFSGAHHVGTFGEPWRRGAITNRTQAGVVFAVRNPQRGRAGAVYTHALYDIYVMLIRGG
jgi:membrane protease YdiL (CAAX protease family)